MTESLYTTIIDSQAPTTSTTGVVGQFYIDTSTTPSALYLCTKVTENTSTTPSTFTYEWTVQGGSNTVMYAHTISVSAGGGLSSAVLTSYFINNVSTAYTSTATLASWLYNNGYNTSFKYILATGGNSWVTGYEYLGLYSPNGTNLYVATKGVSSIEIDGQKVITNISKNFNFNDISSNTITDNVVVL